MLRLGSRRPQVSCMLGLDLTGWTAVAGHGTVVQVLCRAAACGAGMTQAAAFARHAPCPSLFCIHASSSPA